MDDYPAQLAPEFENNGAVKTPFEEWWPRVRHAYPNVPEGVARDWLYRHWGHSPYRHIRSRDYRFTLASWPARDLWSIRSGWCEFEPSNQKCFEQGEFQAKRTGALSNKLAAYILANGDFPVPIIVLDNRDRHMCEENVDAPYKALPEGYVLMEGHCRFNLGLYFESQGKLRPTVNIWIMAQC